MSEPQPEETRRSGASLRAAGVSRAFEGVQALRDVTLELHRHEVVGLIGPNGAGKSTLVNVLSGFDFPDEGEVELEGRDVTLELHRHEVVGLIGPNGAGKSTLVNVLSGFDYPDQGEVELEGRDVTRWRPHQRGRAGLSRTFQHSRSFRGLSVRENVEVAALGVGAGPRDARRRADSLLDSLQLGPYENAPAGSLSHGDERRLGVARALATEPRFVLMDEPAAGLPEAEMPAFAEVVRSVRDEHDAGVLLIDHNMALIMGVCDRIQVLDQGRTLAEGSPSEIRGNLDVAAAYLGESAVHE